MKPAIVTALVLLLIAGSSLLVRDAVDSMQPGTKLKEELESDLTTAREDRNQHSLEASSQQSGGGPDGSKVDRRDSFPASPVAEMPQALLRLPVPEIIRDEDQIARLLWAELGDFFQALDMSVPDKENLFSELVKNYVPAQELFNQYLLAPQNGGPTQSELLDAYFEDSELGIMTRNLDEEQLALYLDYFKSRSISRMSKSRKELMQSLDLAIDEVIENYAVN